MPAEIAVHTTGHYLTQLGSIFEYIDATRALCQPGITALSGFKPFPFGQLGKGPVPASLSSLEALGVSLEVLDAIIDALFSLDSASPPHFRIGGSLRPAVRAAFASQVMYYPDREKNSEMVEVLKRMRDAVRVVCRRFESSSSASSFSSSSSSSSSSSASALNNRPLSPEGPHATLMQWSVHLAAKFKLDNQHLLGGAGSDPAVQLSTAVNQLGITFTNMVDNMNGKLTRVGDRLEVRLGEVEGRLGKVEGQLSELAASKLSPQTGVENAILVQPLNFDHDLAALSSSSSSIPPPPPPPPPLSPPQPPPPSQSSNMGLSEATQSRILSLPSTASLQRPTISSS